MGRGIGIWSAAGGARSTIAWIAVLRRSMPAPSMLMRRLFLLFSSVTVGSVLTRAPRAGHEPYTNGYGWQCPSGLAAGARSMAGLASKKPTGLSVNPVYSTGITG